jgi:hypothetical protein
VTNTKLTPTYGVQAVQAAATKNACIARILEIHPGRVPTIVSTYELLWYRWILIAYWPTGFATSKLNTTATVNADRVHVHLHRIRPLSLIKALL